MKNRLFVPVLLVTVVAVTAPAQTPAPPPSGRPAAAPLAEGPVPDTGRRQRRNTLPATLLLRVVISDQAGAAEAQKKQLDMRMAEGERFFLRTLAQNTPASPRLNADARAEVVGDRASLQLTIEYGGQELGASEGKRNESGFKYQWSELVVELGKPTVVLQTADPAAERKIAIEVTLSAVKP